MKKLFFIFIFSITSIHCFSSNFSNFCDVNFSLAPALLINNDKNHKSAPSPVTYPVSVSFRFPNYSLISFEPGLSFFYNYYLLSDAIPRPAEIENRTGTVLSFFVDLVANCSFTIKKNHTIDLGLGPAFLLRFAMLSNNVNATDFGTSGSAENDVKIMNEYFWSDANFLFAKIDFSYLYKFSTYIKAGPEFKFYVPLGSLFNEQGLNSAMISLGIKIRF